MRFRRLAVAAVAGGAACWLSILPAMAASANIVVTYAGNGEPGYSGDGGQATTAKLNLPTGVVLDNAANLFIADTANNRVRKVTANGVITTIAGIGDRGLSGDGGAASTARLSCPTGLAVNSAGDLFIADTGNNRIRKIAHGVITTVAGNGGGQGEGSCRSLAEDRSREGMDIASNVQASQDADGSSTNFRGPTGVAVERDGVSLLVSDTGHNMVKEVRPDGKIVAFAGTGAPGFSGNTGAATEARLRAPTGITVSGSNVLISDSGNNQVRQVTGGTITAFAGTGEEGFSGDGSQATSAKIRMPLGVSYDPLGNVYIVDAGNHRIRRVTASGVISTFAGTGEEGYSGDGGPAELAEINPAGGVTTDANNIFFDDTFNHRVRRVHRDGPPPALPEGPIVLLAGSAALLLGGGIYVARKTSQRSHSTNGLGIAGGPPLS